MIDKEEIIKFNLWDALLESPVEYKVKNYNFVLYPPSLGNSLLISRYAEMLNNPEDMVYYSLAVCSFENRKKSRMASRVRKRVKQLKSVPIDELMPIYTMFVAWGQDFEKFIKHFRLDVEQRYIKRAHDAKDNDAGSLTFNGKSIYGSLIDAVCERYGWTMEYVMWGISLLNLNMLMNDKVISVFLSKEESRRASIPRNRDLVKMDNNISKEDLLAFLKR